MSRDPSTENENSFQEEKVLQSTNETLDALIDAASDPSVPMKWEVDERPPTVPVRATTGIKRSRQVLFLKHFGETGSIAKSLEAVGINRATERKWRTEDPWYQKQFEDAYMQFKDKIEDEIASRAIDGVSVPIIGKVQTPMGPEDQVIGQKTVKSDLLLMFMAKRHVPEYKEKYEPPTEDNGKTETVSPMTRISVQIENMARRNAEKPALPPPAKQLPEGTTYEVVPEPDAEAL